MHGGLSEQHFAQGEALEAAGEEDHFRAPCAQDIVRTERHRKRRNRRVVTEAGHQGIHVHGRGVGQHQPPAIREELLLRHHDVPETRVLVEGEMSFRPHARQTQIHAVGCVLVEGPVDRLGVVVSREDRIPQKGVR